jgi:hypothetical protein
MSGILGGFLVALGIVILITSIAHIDREWDQFNSPFLWVFLFVGLVLTGFGVVLLVY